MERKPYTVTREADIHTLIAGKRRKAGETVHLTDSEAVFERSRKLIEPAKVDRTAKPKPDAKD